MTLRYTATLTAAAALLAAPVALAQDQQNKQQSNQQQTTQQQSQQQQSQQQQSQQSNQQNTQRQGDQQLSEAARECLNRLEEIDRNLTEVGFGRVGPEGYGTYGGAYRNRGAGMAGTGTVGTGMVGAGLTTPRGDMQTLLRAGYIMAMTGHPDGCQSIVATAEDMRDRYRTAMEEGDRDAMGQWRGDYLASAVSVAELEQPMGVDEILGADIRNMQDEDLGDVENVVLGQDGKVQYVLVETGGFLGIGTDLIPVRWEDLRVTPGQYRDTLVLDVPEEQFDQAPTIQQADRNQLIRDDRRRQEIDTYWQKAGLGDDRG